MDDRTGRQMTEKLSICVKHFMQATEKGTDNYIMDITVKVFTKVENPVRMAVGYQLDPGGFKVEIVELHDQDVGNRIFTKDITGADVDSVGNP